MKPRRMPMTAHSQPTRETVTIDALGQLPRASAEPPEPARYTDHWSRCRTPDGAAVVRVRCYEDGRVEADRAPCHLWDRGENPDPARYGEETRWVRLGYSPKGAG